MHELSIVMSIVDIAEQYATGAEATVVNEIELEIGTLSGIDLGALEFAWNQGVKQTVLENAKRIIHRPEGQAACLDCGIHFPISHYADSCPGCGSHLLHIFQGKELKVKSLLVS